MKIIKLEPQKPAEVIEIEHTLEAMQQVVGGYIEPIYPSISSEAFWPALLMWLILSIETLKAISVSFIRIVTESPSAA